MAVLSSLFISQAAVVDEASEPPLESFLYPEDDVIALIAELGDQRLENSLYGALDALTEFGGDSILICRITRIEAPLGGYLFDGLWNLEKEGKTYTTFRIGIPDGSSDDPFVIIARGTDSRNGVHWYPEPGPDFSPQGNTPLPESMLDYEFLLDRRDFELLEEYYPRPGCTSTE
jgi:hypothetical protein